MQSVYYTCAQHMSKGINVLRQPESEHLKLERCSITVGWILKEILFIKTFCSLWQLGVKLAHVISIGVDVHHVHVGTWDKVHVQLLCHFLLRTKKLEKLVLL